MDRSSEELYWSMCYVQKEHHLDERQIITTGEKIHLNQYCFWSAKRQKECSGAYFAEGQHDDGILRDCPPCIVAKFRACF